MLVQLLHWAAMLATILEGLLLIRMLSLRLQRLYTWLTLYWAVNLIVDAGSWWLGFESKQSEALQLYSWFLFGLLFPLAAWDAFEEMKPVIAKLRLIQGARMVSGLFASLLIGAILFALFAPPDPENELGFLIFAPVVWFVSACASAFFLWTLRFLMKRQNLPVPRNTALWVHVLLVLLGCEVIEGLTLFIAASSAPLEVFQTLALVLDVVAIGAILWALIRLRPAPSDAAPAPQGARL